MKTDAEDARHLAELYYKEELEESPPRPIEQDELRFLSRQHEMISHSYVQAQLNFQSILDQLFPLYSTIFGQLFSRTSLEVLRKYPTPEHVLVAEHNEIVEAIHTASRNRITKRGSTRLRRALYLAVLCGIRGAVRNERIRTFYDKKRLEGKPHRVALIACTNKLLHIIFALLKKSAPYCFP